jgi:hypothetical protein
MHAQLEIYLICYLETMDIDQIGSTHSVINEEILQWFAFYCYFVLILIISWFCLCMIWNKLHCFRVLFFASLNVWLHVKLFCLSRHNNRHTHTAICTHCIEMCWVKQSNVILVQQASTFPWVRTSDTQIAAISNQCEHKMNSFHSNVSNKTSLLLD